MMFPTGPWLVILFFLRPTIVHNVSTCHDGIKNQVIVIALLNIQDEARNCTWVSLRGLQQKIVMEKVAAEINYEEASAEGMHLHLNVVDICSSKETVIDAALKSIVSSNQTCLHPPLLLGFIGPESVQQLHAVQQVTMPFKKFHLLPFKLSGNENVSDGSVLYVGNSQAQIRNKAILVALNQLHWKYIYLVLDEDVLESEILENLLKETERVCISGILKLANNLQKMSTFYSSLIDEFRKSPSDGIVIIAEDPNQIRPLLETMKAHVSTSDIQRPPFFFYVKRVGLMSWELPDNFSLVLLQETSNVPAVSVLSLLDENNHLASQYYEQNELDYKKNVLSDVVDPTILPLEYALKLYWSAAKYAKTIKCKLGTQASGMREGICSKMIDISPSEWITFLFKASYMDQEIGKKISLRMNMPMIVNMYFKDAVTNVPRLAGRITTTGVKDLTVNLAAAIPRVSTSEPKCMSSANPPTSVPNIDDTATSTSWLKATFNYIKGLFTFDSSIFGRTSYVNAILFWVIVVSAFFIGLTLVVKFVYKIFKIKSEAEREDTLRKRYNSGRHISA